MCNPRHGLFKTGCARRIRPSWPVQRQGMAMAVDNFGVQILFSGTVSMKTAWLHFLGGVRLYEASRVTTERPTRKRIRHLGG